MTCYLIWKIIEWSDYRKVRIKSMVHAKICEHMSITCIVENKCTVLSVDRLRTKCFQEPFKCLVHLNHKTDLLQLIYMQ